MKRLTKILLICFFLLFVTLFQENHNIALSNPNHLPDQSLGNSVWMHIDTFFNCDEKQIEQFSLTLNLTKIKNVFILAKNIDGTTTYPSKISLKCYSKDVMKVMTTALRNNGLKVFFYYPINTDPAWIKNNYLDIAYQIGKSSGKKPIPDPTNKLVNLTSEKYQQYIIRLIEEAIRQYSIDGIQLDYIRYTNGSIGFSKEEIEKASQRNIPMEKIIDLTYQTFVNPGDWKTILTRYDQGDQDVLAWTKLREDIVFEFTKRIVDGLAKKTIEIGSTLVSSGANKKAYTAVHFGQNWERLSSILDFVTPMAYHESAEDVEKFVDSICIGAIQKIHTKCKIGIGIQANSTSTSKMMSAINIVKKHNMDFVLFRIGTFSFVNYDFFPVSQNRFTFKMLISNYVESRSIQGLTIQNTGNLFSIESYSPNTILKSQTDTSIQIILKSFLANNNTDTFDLFSTWNGVNSKSCFGITIVASDGKNEIPTFNASSFAIQQLKIDLKTLKSSYNNQAIQEESILLENQKTWIKISTLHSLFKFEVETTPTQTICKRQSTKLVLNNVEKKGILSLDNFDILLDNASFFSHPGYVPLRDLMELFRINLVYNKSVNSIFCTCFSRANEGSFFIQLKNDDTFNLMLTDSTEVLIDFDDYLSNSFYKEASKIHLSGRKLHVLIDVDRFGVQESERIIKLATDGKSNLMIPDQFSYKIYKNFDWKSIPIHRSIILNDVDFYHDYAEMVNSGHKTIVLINKDSVPNNQIYDHAYFTVSCQRLEDQERRKLFKVKVLRNLYLLLNSKL